ncbi:MAG TPA: VWA domain-containing protein [Pirellula sp.]|nr:VWA domain-containing protein [Pirellula sp.]
MSWISALGPFQWILLLMVPPAVLSLYFLKLKRRELAVPSTLLWRKTLEDVHVNSIWQRLRKNLLLYLQLLFLAVLILACLRLGWSGQNRIGDRRIYVIDNSASMQATDVEPTRLDLAKLKVKEMLSDTSADDVGMVIAFSDRADVRQGFTKDRNRLFSAVDSIPTTSRGTDVSEALRAAAGLANPGRSSFDNLSDIMVADAVPATVYLLSDGAFGDLGDFDVGKLKIEYVSIGLANTNNLGIVSFAVQRNEDNANKLEAFARITNPGDKKVEFTASLELDGKLLDASTGSVDAKQEAGLLFELTDTDEGRLKLTLDYDDALKVDNVAYAAIRPSKQISILLVTPGNNALETALQTPRVQQIASVQVESPAFLNDPAFQAAALDANIDLVIFDQCSPKQMPSTNTLFIGSVPPTASGSDAAPSESRTNVWKFGQPQGPALILDVNRSNPITQYLEMGSVSIVEARTIDPGESGMVLMTSDIGPVFSIAPRGPFQDAVLGFSIVQATSEGVGVNTDWGIKRSFPVFVYATVEYLGGGITESSSPSVQPGWPIGLVLSKRFKEFKVVSPDGQTTELVRGDESRHTFTKTEIPGIYQVFAKGIEKPVESFCVNLFSSRESDLAVADSIKMGFESVPASRTTIQARKETWRWILLFALALLVIEWIVFNRRVFI